MAKKGFNTAATEGASVLDRLTSGAQHVQDTEDIQDTRDTKDTKKECYRFNLKMPMEYKDYLQEAAYKASSPTKTITITEYICNLIAADMEERSNE